jgi:hypothetical protein
MIISQIQREAIDGLDKLRGVLVDVRKAFELFYNFSKKSHGINIILI